MTIVTSLPASSRSFSAPSDCASKPLFARPCKYSKATHGVQDMARGLSLTRRFEYLAKAN